MRHLLFFVENRPAVLYVPHVSDAVYLSSLSTMAKTEGASPLHSGWLNCFTRHFELIREIPGPETIQFRSAVEMSGLKR